jgi:hypothetical protein
MRTPPILPSSSAYNESQFLRTHLSPARQRAAAPPDRSQSGPGAVVSQRAMPTRHANAPCQRAMPTPHPSPPPPSRPICPARPRRKPRGNPASHRRSRPQSRRKPPEDSFDPSLRRPICHRRNFQRRFAGPVGQTSWSVSGPSTQLPGATRPSRAENPIRLGTPGIRRAIASGFSQESRHTSSARRLNKFAAGPETFKRLSAPGNLGKNRSCASFPIPVSYKFPCNVKVSLWAEHVWAGIAGVWSGRVAERLMATGCKPVAPWSYGGSNPPPSTKSFVDLL